MVFLSFVKKPPLRALLLGLSATSASILGVALVAQYGFGLHPCELCMLQRYPYVAIIVLGALGAWLAGNPRKLWVIAILCGLLLLADAGIAAYHAGVEWGWFPGLTACTSTTSKDETLEEMRREIMNAPLVPCNQPMVRVLGISMAGWNAVAATLLAIATFIVIRKTKP